MLENTDVYTTDFATSYETMTEYVIPIIEYELDQVQTGDDTLDVLPSMRRDLVQLY